MLADMILLPKRRYTSGPAAVAAPDLIKHPNCIHSEKVGDDARVKCSNPCAADKANGFLCEYHQARVFPLKNKCWVSGG